MRDGTETKERIERTALKLFVDKGVAETSIRAIATKAGVSQGAMYNHYPSKDDLAWELFARNLAVIGAELRRLAQEQPSIEEKFQTMIRYVYSRFDRDWVLVSYVFLVRNLRIRYLQQRRQNPYLAFRAVIAGEIRRGNIPQQDPDIAASLVIGAIIQVIDSKILGLVKQDLVNLTDTVTAACLRLVRP